MMPSTDDTCASCGCTAGAERDHVADRGDVRHRRAIQLVDLDVAALHRDARALRRRAPSSPVRGRWRRAGCSADELLRLAVRRLRFDRRRRCAPPTAFVTFVPVSDLMPCFLNDFSSSAETASSSTGTSRGSSSMIVTSLPKRR